MKSVTTAAEQPDESLGDREKALICAGGNVIVLVLMAAVWWTLPGGGMTSFWTGVVPEGLIIFAYFVYYAAGDLPQATRRAWARLRGRRPAPATPASSAPLSLWPLVLVNMVVWGVLIDVSGGPFDSPFTQIVVILLVTGQLVVVAENTRGLWSSHTRVFVVGAALFITLSLLDSDMRPASLPRSAIDGPPPRLVDLGVILLGLLTSVLLNAIRTTATDADPSDEEPQDTALG